MQQFADNISAFAAYRRAVRVTEKRFLRAVLLNPGDVFLAGQQSGEGNCYPTVKKGTADIAGLNARRFGVNQL